jgi:hypothetical protein
MKKQNPFQNYNPRKFSGLVVGLNALSMGVEYQMNDSDLDATWMIFQIIDLVFLFIFTVELMLRIYVLGLKTFIRTPVLLLDGEEAFNRRVTVY